MKLNLVSKLSFTKFIEKLSHSQLQLNVNHSNTQLISNHTEKNSFDLNSFIKKINNNSYYLPQIDKVIPIIFYDFDLLSLLKNKIFHNLGSDEKEINTSYIISKNKIIVKKENFTKNKYRNFEFITLCNKGCTPYEIAILIISHEIGHAVHHQTFLLKNQILQGKNKESEFLNKTLIFGKMNLECNHSEINQLSSAQYAIQEGFADIYSAFIIKKMLVKERSELILESIIEFREDSNDWKYKWCAQSLRFFVESNKEFESFDELYGYISSVVCDTAIDAMNSNMSHRTSYFIGYLNGFFSYNEQSLECAGKKIHQEFPFITEKYSHDKDDSAFKNGISDGKKSNKYRDKNFKVR